ncbi:MAG: 1,4-alpha-glucan branching protein GlgB [Longimicrobiales bacterium]|nr:1,4-alpha-glucan branching protein GlgB [Longimicrobiales bacterium]
MISPSNEVLEALVEGRYATPFDVLGLHPVEKTPAAGGSDRGWIVRVWAPGAATVDVLARGRVVPASRRRDAPVFEASFPETAEVFPYRVKIDGREQEDPYRFLPVLSDAELVRLRKPDGRIHQVLGAHPTEHQGAPGTVFSVWAPHARAVSLVGTFNDWVGNRHPMRPRGASGVWELFLPGIGPGVLYKYRIIGPARDEPMLKSDPCGRAMQLRPENASVVTGPSTHAWTDEEWLVRRSDARAGERPISVYEVHLSSWRRKEGADARRGEPGWKSYEELADELIPYVGELGFTHIELMPVTEHPYDASWGYQTVGYFAPTSRHGDADGLRYLVDRAHAADIGVILDWVPAHFPRDAHGLGYFDGTHLYEHADPRKGVHPDWGTYIFNYARQEVVVFLVSSALYWIEEFHVDGLRLDAVASMLYLDYSREEGQWVPNKYGGRENIEAADFLRTLNQVVHARHPGLLMVAEESTAWPGVTHGHRDGGLGFDLKWNMGWMHDTLEIMQSDTLFRSGQYEKLTFGITYAFAERFLLAFSHDEVVHLKGSMLRKMPGSTLDKFANLRLLYGYMWTHPGKKLLFMGSELAMWTEWDDHGELDWALLEEPMHAGVHDWIGVLNEVYATEPALHATDFTGHGFEWIDCHDRDRTTLAYLRWSPGWEDFLAVVCNFTPVAWEGYRLALPFPGTYEIVLDSDAEAFGGSGSLQASSFETVDEPHLGRDQYVELTLPGLSTLVLKWVAGPREVDGEGGRPGSTRE